MSFFILIHWKKIVSKLFRTSLDGKKILTESKILLFIQMFLSEVQNGCSEYFTRIFFIESICKKTLKIVSSFGGLFQSIKRSVKHIKIVLNFAKTIISLF